MQPNFFDMTNTNSSLLSETLRSAESKALDFAAACCGAPPDWPHRALVLHSVFECLQALQKMRPDIQVEYLRHLRLLADQQATGDSTERNLLRGRTQAHRLYQCLIDIARRRKIESPEVRTLVLRIVGNLLLIRFLDGQEPKASSFNLLRDGLNAIEPHRYVDALGRALSNATKRLNRSIERNPQQSTTLGLSGEGKEESLGPRTFDEAVLRHAEGKLRSAEKYSAQGTLGHHTLARPSLLHIGSVLKARVDALDHSATILCIQALTGLTYGLVMKLPLVWADAEARELAWINVTQGHFCYRLELVTDVPKDTALAVLNNSLPVHCASLCLPKFLFLALKHFCPNESVGAKLGDFLNAKEINPRSSLFPSKGHTVTLRRIQETIQDILLLEGHHRWVVAVATLNWQLTSRGRRAYSACASESIHQVTSATYKLLGWDEGLADPLEYYFGSPLTPRPESISRAANFLQSQCLEIEDLNTSAQLNSWAARTSFVCALGLALRLRVEYPLDYEALLFSQTILINDKDVHQTEIEIPVAGSVRSAMQLWNRAVVQFLARLELSTNPSELKLAGAIRGLGSRNSFPVFRILGNVAVVPAGTGTWSDVLPLPLKLIQNFGRHYWPMKLGQMGVSQRLVDLLMRHATTHVSHFGRRTSNSLKKDQDRLRDALEKGLQEVLPSSFQVESKA